MANFSHVLMHGNTTVLQALGVIDRSSLQVALVVDERRRLRGTLTDGDIRRALLRGHDLQTPVEQVMNTSPTTAGLDTPDDQLMVLMVRRSIKELPIVDNEGHVVGLKLLSELAQIERHDNVAVIMAGGLGTRLADLTRSTPKPLLPVGNRPIIGTIVSQLVRHGYGRIVVAVNYLAEKIEAYLGDGRAFGAEINYLHEKERLGTAGALSLLPERPSAPFLVMNGDILASVNFNNVMDFHRASGRMITVCVRDFQFRVPYGVMQLHGTDLVGIEEKPTQNLTINAGIYALSPDVLDWLEPGQPCDMPTLIDRAIRTSCGVTCFPLQQYWLDIGRLEDFERAQVEFDSVFGSDQK